jgi:hypothetical protein
MLALAALCGVGMGQMAVADDTPPNEVSGIIRTINGGTLLLASRSGALVRVDAAQAILDQMTSLLRVGGAVTVLGARDPAGVLHAVAINRAKSSPQAWPDDH